jgi:hypothetical protein
VHLYTHTYKAYSETFKIDILLLTLYTTVHIHILMWGAVGSDAVDVGRIWLGRRWRGAQDIESLYVGANGSK